MAGDPASRFCFRCNKNTYIVNVLVRRNVPVKRHGQDMYSLARGRNQSRQVPTARLQHAAAHHNGMSVEPALDDPLVLPIMVVQVSFASAEALLVYLKKTS